MKELVKLIIKNQILVDGFRVAEEIRLKEPETFDLLTSVPWDFGNRSTLTDYRWKTPMIKLDNNGKIEEIRVGNFLRVPLQIHCPQSQTLLLQKLLKI